jgi:IclR family transcriptional regulator, acetate operon repressor
MSSVKEIRSVRNACAVIEAVAGHQPVGVSELARVTGIDKSAVHRLAVTLQHARWLDSTGDGRWRVSAELVRLVRLPAIEALVASMHHRLEQLRDDTGETVMLVVIEQAKLVVLDVVDSRHNLRITAPVGSELPLLHSSASRAIAAYLPVDELAALRRAYARFDDDQTLAEVRRRGWAINDREIVDDARVVGAPVLTLDGYPLAAIIVCAPASRVSVTRINEMGQLAAKSVRPETTE